MKNIICLFLIVFTSISFCQKYDLASTVNGLKFSLSVDSINYHITDSIFVILAIENLSDVSFYVYDYSKYNYPAIIYDSKIGFDLGGVFNLSFNRINKLQILKPSESLSFKMIAHLDSVRVIKDTQYLLYADIGYYNYDEKLKYLSNTDKKIVPVKNDNDMYKLTVLHQRLLLGYVPITLIPKN